MRIWELIMGGGVSQATHDTVLEQVRTRDHSIGLYKVMVRQLRARILELERISDNERV